MRISAVLRLVAAYGLRQIHGCRFLSELHIDGFAFGLIRPLEVRSMAFTSIVGAGALGFAALHHALEKRPFAEVLQLLELPL